MPQHAQRPAAQWQLGGNETGLVCRSGACHSWGVFRPAEAAAALGCTNLQWMRRYGAPMVHVVPRELHTAEAGSRALILTDAFPHRTRLFKKLRDLGQGG